MSTANRNKGPACRTALAAATLLLAAPLAGMAEGNDTAAATERVSATRVIERGGRDAAPGDSVRHRYGALVRGGKRAVTGSMAGKSASDSQKSGNEEVWFYTADVVLLNDDDYDGYFRTIDLLFDADTIYDEIDVYAAVFLSLEGGPWNEYAVTGDFTLFGATSDDEYVIVTDLESGYPTGDYDLLIELYDAVDGTFLASFGPSDTSELSYLPLEDYVLDTPVVEEVVVIGHGHSHGGGGTGYGLLPLMLLPLVRRLARGAAGGPCA